MSKLRFKISMSLNGFVAGPSQSVKSPLRIGGQRLHEWAFPLAAFRALRPDSDNEKMPSHNAVQGRQAHARSPPLTASVEHHADPEAIMGVTRA